MSFASDNGYTPISFRTFMELVMVELNVQFDTGYTYETFEASNHYKYYYAIAQRVIENENKTAEIFAKLQNYIAITNEKIQRPSVSLPGLIEAFESRGYEASVAPTSTETAGNIFIAVNVDDQDEDYEATKLEINTLIKDFVAAGLVSNGTEVSTIVLSNGQSFDFKFNLPTPIPLIIRLTVQVSDNYPGIVLTDEQLRNLLFLNFSQRYKMGWDLEPQRYMTQADLPWAAEIIVEWSNDDGETWSDAVIDLSYSSLVTFGLEDITVVFQPGGDDDE